MAKEGKPRKGEWEKPFAKRSLGQNFLVDGSVIGKILYSLALSPEDAIIEIGPGRGALTEALVGSGANVAAIEIDRDLASELKSRFSVYKNFHLFEEDVLEADILKIARSISGESKLKLVGNLPYNISTPILRRLFKSRSLFSEITVMLQKEVAERIIAEPGTSERGFITVLVERGFASDLLFTVPPGAFRPIPKVTSAVLRLVPRKEGANGAFTDGQFEELVGAAFAQKRKTLKNNLNAAPKAVSQPIGDHGGTEEVISRAGIAEKARAESLSLAEWTSLATEVFGTV